MNEDAVLYSKTCQMQKFEANYFLDSYLKLLNLQDNDKVLDVGVAEATITLEVLLPKLPNFSKLVLADISEKMVHFSKNRTDDERMEVVQMDITSDTMPFEHYFDHVFSFFCLNCVPEDRTPKAMQNIFEMLTPGGSFLTTIIASVPLFDIYKNMTKEKKWPPAMANYQKIVSPYYGLDNPEEKLKFFLSQAGFDVQVCKHEKRKFTYEGLSKFLDFALSIVPILKVNSRSEQMEFIKNFKEEIRKSSMIYIEGGGDSEKVHMFYSVLVACASKPK